MNGDRITALLRRLAATFGGFSAGQKAATICTVLALVVGGFFFSRWASTPSLAPLYTNLSGSDASAIVEELTATGTPYELTDGGQTILVPQDKVYDLRLTMSGEGLPAGKDTGYSLLDKQGVTTSEFKQRVDYQRALEGELASTIGSIEGVADATVHLAIPVKDVFTDEASKPTASVLVDSGPGQRLEANQVQAIVHLVSSSVVDLDADQVTVADGAGTILSSGSEDAMVGAAGSSRDQQTQQFEQRMNGSLQQMLDQVVGPGHAVVKITADLDYDQTDTKSQTYVSDGKTPPLSQTKTDESYTGTGNAAGGVLGSDGLQAQTTANGGNGQYRQTTETRDNAVGVVTETRKSAPGAVRKLAVAVLLDSRTAANVDTAAVEELVSSAVGFDAKRGDTMAVSALPFDQTAANDAKQALAEAHKADEREQQIGMAKSGAIGLAVLVLFLGALRSMRRKRKAGLTAQERAQLEEMQAALEQSRALALAAGGADRAALGAGQPDEPDRTEQREREDRQRELAELVERQPEDVAQLLRSWLADSRS